MFDDDPPRFVRGRRPSTQFVSDVVLVIALVAVVAGVAGSARIGGSLPQPVTDQVLTCIAAVVAAGGAILGAVGAHLLEDPRPRWVAAALALYALVVLPASAFLPATGDGSNAEGLRLVGYTAAILMLLCAVRPPARIGARGTWLVTAVAVVVSVAAFLGPQTPGSIIRSPVATGVIVVAWTAVAAAVVVDGYRRNVAARWRAGLGLVVISGGQLVRMLVGTAQPVFGVLRIAGLVIVVVGFAQLIVRAIAELNDERFAHQEDLVSAALYMERAAESTAERDHELRNGLAGLAGITHLLSTDTADEQHQRLKHAVLSELSRLHQLLDGGPPRAEGGPVFAVAPVIEGLVTLRRTAGADIEAEIEPGLSAAGDSAVLAQVITNLLANCDRHASGAPIRIRAFAEGDLATVEVRDEGPGLPAGPAAHLLDRGVRDADAGGLGLGLNISRDLVERQGGTLGLRSAGPDGGCVARVSVPLVRAAQPADRRG